MTTLTISKELTKEKDLVVIPKRTYIQFLEWQKAGLRSKVNKSNSNSNNVAQLPKKIRYFTPTANDLRILRQARKDYVAGKSMTLGEFNNALANRRSS